VLEYDEARSTIHVEAMTQREIDRSVFKRPIISPLRYPGGKSALYVPLRSLVRANGLTSGTYVEPYAGGAGAALALLVTGQVQRIVINDLDPAIYAFWHAVVRETAAFSHLVDGAALDLREWSRQREIYLTAAKDDYLQLGFATFYLNRTNRSGALNGGVIGGKKQVGRYKIDARFNKTTLMERVRLIGIHSNRISVSNMDGLSVIEQFADDSQAFVYADPPYFDRSSSLYLNAFTEENHVALAATLNNLPHLNWLLTYDNVTRVHELYAERRRDVISLSYSAHRVLKASEVIVYSDALDLGLFS
jgi:DNA adenine methylase